MTERATFSLEEKSFNFLNEVAGKNRSAYTDLK